MNGVGEGEGLTEELGEALPEGETLAEGLFEALGDCDLLAELLGLTEADGDTEGLAE